MTDEEIEVVAEELAKLVRVPWVPGYEITPLLHVVTECHRAEARAILAALDQIRPVEAALRFRLHEAMSRKGFPVRAEAVIFALG